MKIETFAFMRESPFYTQYEQLKKAGLDGGKYNGYVGFKAELPTTWTKLAECSEHNVLDNLVEVHGGITFDSNNINKLAAIIPLTDIPKDWYNYRIIGFDCMHCYDTEENCPVQYIKDETMSLLKQIQKLINNLK